MNKPGARVAVCGIALLTACAATSGPVANTPAVAVRSACAVVEGKPSSQDDAAAAALRRSVETTPLYTIPAARGLVACRVRYRPAGEIVLEYTFRGHAWLRVTRNERIEYTEQIARFALPPGERPEVILARAEHEAFGDNGCGIDWRKPESQPLQSEGIARETVFHGETCNCQARIRRSADGQTVKLILRSAC